MLSDIRENEFKVFGQVRIELRHALADNDLRTADLALKELQTMRDYSDWPALRHRIAAELAQFSMH